VLVVVLMIAANLLGIALTWSARGQFMAPVQPMLAALVGALGVALVRAAVALAGRLRSPSPAPSATGSSAVTLRERTTRRLSRPVSAGR
jgi:hypothetical protein